MFDNRNKGWDKSKQGEGSGPMKIEALRQKELEKLRLAEDIRQ